MKIELAIIASSLIAVLIAGICIGVVKAIKWAHDKAWELSVTNIRLTNAQNDIQEIKEQIGFEDGYAVTKMIGGSEDAAGSNKRRIGFPR